MKYEDKAQLILKILMANASPLTAGDITRELSSTRVLIDAAVSALLDANNSGFFEKRVVGYFLTDDQRHLEIDESKFEEYEFDDL